mmetsp:Transcript_5772/g.13696  ORF Transcript_5772/g.13696 Transcript_5772/m.13696 type:complete len:361 (+) Transcript_5772:77-1159(+)
MSLQACFEKHVECGSRHSEVARMGLEDAASAWMRANLQPGGPTLPTAVDSVGQDIHLRRARQAVKIGISQQQLAVREFRDAARLRPRNVEVKKRLAAAIRALKKLQATLASPETLQLQRFYAHFNLAIRYWDSGNGSLALKQAKLALAELHNLGLGGGCAEHTVQLIEHVQAESRKKERELLDAVERAPNAVTPSYKLGVHYFDKRQLARAEAQLKHALDRARTASALQLVERDRQRLCLEKGDIPQHLQAETRKDKKLSTILSDLQDDLDFLTELQQRWTADAYRASFGWWEAPRGKRSDHGAALDTVAVASPQLRLSPCLRRRFSADCRACDEWWAQLCGCPEVDVRIPHATPSGLEL